MRLVMYKWGLVVWVVVLMGCSSSMPPKSQSRQQKQEPPVVPVINKQALKMSDSEKQRIIKILSLLDNADLAVKEKRLTLPRGDNAADYYRQVLRLQPGYQEAEQGLDNIVDRYLEWSDAAVQQGRLDQARHYLVQARRVDELDPRVTEAAKRIRQQAQQGSGYTRLDSEQIRLRSAAMITVLGRLADKVRVENARVIIEAPSDAQGRWIYQQMNRRHEEYRIRANMQIEPQAGVRLLY